MTPPFTTTLPAKSLAATSPSAPAPVMVSVRAASPERGASSWRRRLTFAERSHVWSAVRSRGTPRRT